MREPACLLRGNVKQGRRFALHVTGITGLLVAHVKGMRRLFRKRRLLQLVGDHEGAQEFVIVQLARDLRLVTGATKLGLLQERPHHRPAMRGNIIENLLIRNRRPANGSRPLSPTTRVRPSHVPADAAPFTD